MTATAATLVGASTRGVARAVARLVLLVALILGAGVIVAAMGAPAVRAADDGFQTVSDALLEAPPLPDRLPDPAQRSTILAHDGSTLAILHGVENRKLVAFRDIPPRVRNAVIATEDAHFYTHRGVDWLAVGRAFIGNTQADEVRSGASTITQQLVRNIILEDRSVTYRRKVREALLSVRLERMLPKDAILERYLNLVYFGNGVYGIGTASEYYFDRPVDELTIDQAAMLAGIIRAPIANDPFDHRAAAKRRRNIVLGQMVAEGFVAPNRLQELRGRGLGLRRPKRLYRNETYFTTYIRELLENDPAFGPDEAAREGLLLRGGLTIRTTLRPRLHRLANRAIRKVLPRPNGPQASLVAVDPRNGQVLALGAGPRPFGEGKGRTKVTPAVRGLGSTYGRQPGSSFKAFALVAALEDGIGPTFTYESGSHYKFKRDCGTKPYDPGNYADSDTGTLTMYEAIAVSSNSYFSHLADRLGPDKIVDAAQRMGIRSDLEGHCSTVLGSEEVFGLDMASAYGTLANRGVYCAPYAIKTVTDSRGRTLLRNRPRCDQAIDEDIAVRATDMLRGPIENGTASSNGQIGRPAAGKTGTTNDYGDAWFIGFVPQLSASSWVGHQNATKSLFDSRCGSGRVTGGCLPTMIWSRFMRAAIKDLPVRQLPEPPQIERDRVPSLVGDDISDARRIVDAAGFVVLTERVSSGHPEGTVVRQVPRPGVQHDEGADIRLFISDGEGPAPTVPNLIGLTREEADAFLRDLGIIGQAYDVPVRNPRLKGLVIRQQPEPGSPLDEDTQLTVEVGI